MSVLIGIVRFSVDLRRIEDTSTECRVFEPGFEMAAVAVAGDQDVIAHADHPQSSKVD